MASLRLITSLAELRREAEAWDDLWSRTPRRQPLARAEQVAAWVEFFAPEAKFWALVVEQGTRWLAALPLVGQRVAGCLPVGMLPTNDWSEGGQLLYDPTAASMAVAPLVAGMRQVPWPAIWLNNLDGSAAGVRWLLEAAERAHMANIVRPLYCSGRVQLASNWEEFFASRGKKHRANMRRNLKRLEALAPTRLHLLRNPQPTEVTEWVTRGFGVEDRCWKGEGGSSVWRTPGMLGYFQRQAVALADRGELWLGFLEHGQRPIAFDYGYVAGGTIYRSKIGYDREFAGYSPGQVLACLELEWWHERRSVEQVVDMDFLGPLSDALEKWTTEPYPMQRVVIARPGLSGRLLVEAYRAYCRRADSQRARHAANEETALSDSVLTVEDGTTASLSDPATGAMAHCLPLRTS